MMIRAVYFHAVDGRMRIQIAEVKGSQAKAREIEERLCCGYGIIDVNANPVTGNVLINYDSGLITQQAVLERLRAMGCLTERESVALGQGVESQATPWWGVELVKFGLETLLTALIL